MNSNLQVDVAFVINYCAEHRNSEHLIICI